MAITVVVTGGAVQLTGNPVFINCTGAAVPFGASEYMVLLRVISQDEKLEGAPMVDAKIPQTGGTTIFDISGILDQSMEVTFDTVLTAKIITHPTQAFNIQVQPGERFINQYNLLEENWFSVSPVFQMIKGGLSPRQNAMMKTDNETYFSKYIQGKKYLTPRPQSDLVHPLQPVKLWYMPFTNGPADFVIRGSYTDNSEDNYVTELTLNTDNLYEINCNPTLHGLKLERSPGVFLRHFEVYLYDYPGQSYLSDIRRFVIDLNYCERPYFLFFANSLGGIDDVYLNGFGVDSFQTEGTLAYRPARPNDTVYTPTILSSNKTGTNKWVINSGWKSIPTIQFYRDLMLSKQAWFLYPNLSSTSSIIIPVIIENFDAPLINRQDDQWNIDIQFSEAHSSRFSFDNRSY